MYLVAASAPEVASFRKSTKRSGVKKSVTVSYLSEFSPLIAEKGEAAFLMSDDGKKQGYIVTTAELDRPKYSFALAEVSIRSGLPGGLIRLLPNIIRSFKLNSILARSDDAELMRAVAHYSFSATHIFEVYELAPGRERYEDPDDVILTEADSFKVASLLADGDAALFSPEIFDKKRRKKTFKLSHNGKTVGGAVVTQFGDAQADRAIFPVITEERRREGFGVTLVEMVADSLIADKKKPVLVIQPEDATSRNFVSSLDATPRFDLLRLQPQFHTPPILETEE